MQQVRERVVAGEVEAAGRELDDVQLRTARARALTSDLVWTTVGVAPFVGDDVRAVATLAREVDVLASDVLPPLVEAAGVLDPTVLQPVDGTVALDPFVQAAPLLSAAVDDLDGTSARVQALDPDDLLGPVARAREDLLLGLEDAGGVLRPAATAVTLLPGMLGGEGPRDYLLLFQTNAEIRATGGMPGAFAMVRAEQGRLSLVGQGAPAQVTDFDPPAPGLPDDTARLFENEPAIYFQDVNFTADFPLAASMARTMYAARTGVEVSGVLATDPVALSYLLGASGPVTVPGGLTLTAEGAADRLLNGIYLELAGQPDAQNAVFAAAAATVFETVTAGSADPAAMLEALGRSAGEGRLLLWSADPGEQSLIAGTAVAGPLRPAGTGQDPPAADPSTPVIGLFLNGAVASKLDYYLRMEVALSAPVCRIGDLTRYDLTVDLTSTAPSDAATSLPVDVLGPADLAPPGVNRVQVLGYAPDGGSFGQVRENGEAKPFGTGSDGGRPAALTTVLLDPGERTTVIFEVLVPGAVQGAPVVRATPMAAPVELTVAGDPGQRVTGCD